jgi:hypothetical protein
MTLDCYTLKLNWSLSGQQYFWNWMLRVYLYYIIPGVRYRWVASSTSRMLLPLPPKKSVSITHCVGGWVATGTSLGLSRGEKPFAIVWNWTLDFFGCPACLLVTKPVTLPQLKIYLVPYIIELCKGFCGAVFVTVCLDHYKGCCSCFHCWNVKIIVIWYDR